MPVPGSADFRHRKFTGRAIIGFLLQLSQESLPGEPPRSTGHPFIRYIARNPGIKDCTVGAGARFLRGVVGQ
jgi:hypothetical protein